MLVRCLRWGLIIVLLGSSQGRCLGQTPDFGCGFSIPCRLPSARMARALAKHVNFAGIADPNTTLEDALLAISDKYDVVFDVCEIAFKAEGVNQILKVKVAEQPLARMENVLLRSVLQTVLARISVSSGATFYLERDLILITTRAHASLNAFSQLRRESKNLFTALRSARLTEYPDTSEDIVALVALVAYWDGVLVDNAGGIPKARFDPIGLKWLKRACGFRP